jgi:PAS domain S-box-containing protein
MADGSRGEPAHANRTAVLLAGEKRVLEAISTRRPLPAVLDLLVREIEPHADSGIASILLVDPTSHTLQLGAAPNLPDSLNRALEGMPVAEGSGSCGTAAFRNEPVIVTDVETDPLVQKYREVLREHGIAALWSYPIQASDNSVLGTFAIYFREARGPSPFHREVVERAAHIASIAIERDRTEAARRDGMQRAQLMADRMSAVAAAASGVLRARSLDELNETLRRTIRGVLPYDVYSFATYDGAEHALHFLECADGDVMVPAATQSAAGMASEPALLERRSLLTTRADEAGAPAAQPFGSARRSASIIHTPVLAGDVVLGLMSVHSYTPDAYSVDDVTALEAFAAVAASAIQNIELLNEVRAREAHYRRLVTTSPMGIYAVNEEGRIVEANTAIAAVVGREPDELIGLRFTVLLPPEEHERAETIYAELQSGRWEPGPFEIVLLRPSGERRLVEIHSAVILGDDGFQGSHGLVRDITEERAQAERMRMFSAALENLSEGVCVCDDEGNFLYTNAAHARALGYDPGYLPDGGMWSFLPADESRDQLRKVLEYVRDHGSWSGQMRRRRVDGRILPLEFLIQRVAYGDRHLLFTISRDISAELDQAQRLRRVERLASMGTLISGVAHELNNPLSAILGFADLLLLDETSPERRGDLQTIRRESERMAKIVSDLRILSRRTQHPDGDKREAVDLNDVVRHVLHTRGYSLSTRNVAVVQDLFDDLPPVHGERGQLEQVVLNLVVNAEQAFEAWTGEKQLLVRTRATTRGVSLHVVDNGPGIPPDELDRIFDPFWTTKPPGVGTGLGLSMVLSILNEHSGEIHVDSEPGKGAAFRIDLPRPPTQGEPRPMVAAAAAPCRALRLLVVDDEPSNRRILCRVLERRGHHVDTAEEGGAALALLDKHTYDVIVSDLRMPGMSGHQLYARLQERGDSMVGRIIFLTGDTACEELAEVPSVPILAKPIDFPMLAEAIETLAETPR